MAYALLNGIRLHYDSAGSGDAVPLLRELKVSRAHVVGELALRHREVVRSK
jgi:hypothetical protein